MPTIASAPAKVILLGEHAAVYGNPVLVATVDLRTRVKVEAREDDNFLLTNECTGVEELEFSLDEIPSLKEKWETVLTAEAIEKSLARLGVKTGLNIEITSEAPVSSGMGSSASAASAMALGISKELGFDLEKGEIADLAWDIENIIHGKSSGVDPYSTTFGGILRYKKGSVSRVKAKEYPRLTIGDTMVQSDTKDTVMDVMKLKERYPEWFEKYLKMMMDIIDNGQIALEEGDLEKLGEIMDMNHGLLSAIKVSSRKLDELVWAARESSQGAKLCGAGRGGIMIALGDCKSEIEKAGGKVITTRIAEEGVRVH